MVRRAVAGVALVVVVILMVIGIHSCQVSATNSALKTYNTNVGMLVQQSDATGASLFKTLTGASSNPNVQTQLDNEKNAADHQYSDAQNLSAPGQVNYAQANFELALKLRRDGIADIASNIQPALSSSKSTSQQAINTIATDMEKFLTSDVVYTTQTATGIASALHAAGIPVGGSSGETIQATNFFPDLAWLTPGHITKQLGAASSASTSSASGPNPCPSTCGHMLNTVSVGGVQLSTGGANTIPASPAPTFTANFTNTGQSAETQVKIVATVTTSSGTTITGSTVVNTTQPSQSYNAQIPLSKSPPTGSASVTVKVLGVPGETNLANNALTFPVTFD